MKIYYQIPDQSPPHVDCLFHFLTIGFIVIFLGGFFLGLFIGILFF